MFIFKGMSSDDKGVFNIKHFPIPSSNLRIQEKTIPGRDGVVIITDNSYEGCEITADVYAMCNTPQERDDVIAWLQGSGKLIIEGAEDRYYNARVSNMVPISQFLINEIYAFPLRFKCQPFGYLLSGDQSTKYNAVYNSSIDDMVVNVNIPNLGNAESKPLIVIEGNDDIILSINDGPKLKIWGASGKVIIDCDLMQASLEDGEDYGEYVEGDFPKFPTGTFKLYAEGADLKSVTVTPRWRCL